MIEPYPLEFLADKPDAKYACDFVVIENIRVDRIDRHDRAAGFQHDEIARLDSGHWQSPRSEPRIAFDRIATIANRPNFFARAKLKGIRSSRAHLAKEHRL
jgi:hypothetical protein